MSVRRLLMIGALVPLLALTAVACQPFTTEVTTHSAMLGTWATATDASMDFYFRYGTDPSLAAGYVDTDVVNKSGLTPGTRYAVQVPVDGLAPGGRYYYQICGKAHTAGTFTCDPDIQSFATVQSPIPSTAPPLPAVEASSSLGAMHEPADIAMHDKGQSVEYDDGSNIFSYWSFGDTRVVPNGASQYWVGNTGAKTSDRHLDDNIDASSWTYDNPDAHGDPHEAIALPAPYVAYNATHGSDDQYRIWGGSMAADPTNHRIISIYHLEKGSGSAPVGVGYGLAIWTPSTDSFTPVTIDNSTEAGTSPSYLLWLENPADPTSEHQFNTGMVLAGGYLYVYGCPTVGWTPTCNLARVSVTTPSAVSDRSAWSFYTGAGSASCTPDTWTSDVDCTAPVPAVAADGGASQLTGGSAGSSVYWNPYLGEYVDMYSVRLTNRLAYRVAYRPEGPWSEEGTIAQGIAPVSGIDYAGYAHPEFAEENGRIEYMTYYRVTGPSQSEFDLLKVRFGLAPAAQMRASSTEAYYGQGATTTAIAAAGPVNTTEDRYAVVYDHAAVGDASDVVVHVDSQGSLPGSIAGIALRNDFSLAHNSFFTTSGQGYIALVEAPSGGVSLRWDSDGDQYLDSAAPSAPNGVSGPVWLRLNRTGPTSYQGWYSTSSTNGTDGTWTSVGTTTVPTAAALQDAAMISAGPDAAHLNAATFSGFSAGAVDTWATSPSLESSTGAYATGFDHQTLRQTVHTSIGGTSVRVRVSNAAGTSLLHVGAASVALPDVSPPGPDLAAGSIHALTFNGGQSAVSIPAHREVYSDPVPMQVTANSDLAVNLYFDAPTGRPTWHNASLHHSYLYTGNQTATASGASAVGTPSAWYFLGGISVTNPQARGTVVALGDSITDGLPCCQGPTNTWPSHLISQLAGSGMLTSGIVNEGQVGSTLWGTVTGSTARLAADVLAHPDVRTVVVALGVNDLISGTLPTAAAMEGQLDTLIAQLHAGGVRVIGTTITPLGSHQAALGGPPAQDNELVRQAVNAYIRSGAAFDEVVDLDAQLRDNDSLDSPPTITQMKPELNYNPAQVPYGGVHPNDAGADVIATAVRAATLVPAGS